VTVQGHSPLAILERSQNRNGDPLLAVLSPLLPLVGRLVQPLPSALQMSPSAPLHGEHAECNNDEGDGEMIHHQDALLSRPIRRHMSAL
jgi:hypothetical protein